jgi:hypothetical protein
MNPNDKQQTDLQNIFIALNQYGERQNGLLKKTENLVIGQGQLLEKITKFESQLADMKAIPSKINPVLLRAILQETIEENNQKRPQPPTCKGRTFHIHLIPEREAAQYFRMILVRCCMWFMILAGIFYLYKLGIRWMDQHHIIQVRAIENQSEQKAWLHLYRQADKKLRKRMDSIFLRTSAKKIPGAMGE